MLAALEGLADALGRGPAAALLLLIALAVALMPVWTWRERGRWPAVRARAVDVANRRTLATQTWAVRVAFVPAGGETEIDAVVPVNLQRTPLAQGDTLVVLHHPEHPGRVARDRWQGAATPWMVAPLIALAAAAVLRGP